MSRVVGFILVASVMGSLFGATVLLGGLSYAIYVWLVAMAGAAVLTLGLNLLFS